MSLQKETISTINGLIETLKDGQEGFRRAAEAVQDSQLRSLFNQFSMQRSRFAGELQSEALGLGESDPENSSSTAGAMHRAWINLKAAITSGDDHAILAECERGEDSAVSEYKKAMEDKDLTAPVRETISRQYTEVKAAHDRVRALRDAAKKLNCVVADHRLRGPPAFLSRAFHDGHPEAGAVRRDLAEADRSRFHQIA